MPKEVTDCIKHFIFMPYSGNISGETEKEDDTKYEPDNTGSQITMKLTSGLNSEQNYATLTKEQLMLLCIDKDVVIASCVRSLKENPHKMLGKKDIMELYNCESNKALRILKLMFQMGYGNKIGKEYYVSWKAHEDFVKKMVGKEVFI